jgi:hypothetical protein
VVGIAQPQALADAALKLLTDPQRWHAAQAAGIARVERYYTQDMMFGAYCELYQRSLGMATRTPTLHPASRCAARCGTDEDRHGRYRF